MNILIFFRKKFDDNIKNVVYTNLNNILKADVVEINIKTKDTKIFMYENEKKEILKVEIKMAIIKKFRIKSLKILIQ